MSRVRFRHFQARPLPFGILLKSSDGRFLSWRAYNKEKDRDFPWIAFAQGKETRES